MTRKRIGWSSWWIALCLSAALLHCQGGPTTQGSCTSGQKVCANNRVFLCLDGRSFQEVEICASGQSCHRGACLAPLSCEAGERYCLGETPMVCNGQGSHFEQRAPCARGEVCHEGQCISGERCQPGDKRCQGNAIAFCQVGGIRFEKLLECPQDHRCEEGQCVRKLGCTPGTKRCQGAEVWGCDADGEQFSKLAACAGGQLCREGRCISTSTCTANETLCQGQEIWRCKADGSEFVKYAQCAAQERCEAGRCRKYACDPGETQCQGQGVWVCADDRRGFRRLLSCTREQRCHEGKCEPKEACQPTSLQCKGAEIWICKADGSGYEKKQSCPETHTCEQGRCVPQPRSCQPGEWSCRGDELWTCKADGMGYELKQKCGPGLCKGGTCESPRQCQVGQWKCQNNELWTCKSDGSSYQLKQKCSASQRCREGRCEDKPTSCTPGHRKCQGQEVWVCDAKGAAYSRQLICPAGQQCAQGQCKAAPLCPGHAARCQGRSCGDDGFGGSCGACAKGLRCDNSGRCVACTPRCQGKVCGSDGCGGTCGTCPSGRYCSMGECSLGRGQDGDELQAIYYINQFRISTAPMPKSCNHDKDKLIFADPRPLPPSRLNADMIRNARLFAQHVVDWRVQQKKGFCGHTDPLEPKAPYRLWTYLGEVGLQNCWCGYVAPKAAPITGDPWHCRNMLAKDANEWGLGHSRMPTSGAGYQVQDIGTDSAYLTVLINNEALTTQSHNVQIYVLPEGIFNGRPFRFMDRVKEVQISEDRCFRDAKWQPHQALLPYTLSPGQGRKVVWVRARDVNGQTFVSWDSIYVGAPPSSPDIFKDAIQRIRSVRLPPLQKQGYDQFQYSLGAYREAELMEVWWGHKEKVKDPQASGGYALRLYKKGQTVGKARIWTGARHGVPVGDGSVYIRLKTDDISNSKQVAWIGFREDSGPPATVGHLRIRGTDFKKANAYQWFRLPFKRAHEKSLFYIEMETYTHGTLIDRYDIYSGTQPTGHTTRAGGLTLDFEKINTRGMELQIRFVNSSTGAFVDGPKINPYCSLCGN